MSQRVWTVSAGCFFATFAFVALSTIARADGKLDWLEVSNQCNAAHGMPTEKAFEQATSVQRRDAMDCVDYYNRHGRMPKNGNDLGAEADKHADWINSLCFQSNDMNECLAWARAIHLTQSEAKNLVRLFGKRRI